MVTLGGIEVSLEESDVVVVSKSTDVAGEDGGDTGSSDGGVGGSDDGGDEGDVVGEGEELGDVDFDVEGIEGGLAAVEALVMPRDDGLLSSSLAARAGKATRSSSSVRDLVVALPDIVADLTSLDVAQAHIRDVLSGETGDVEAKAKSSAHLSSEGGSRGGLGSGDGILLEVGVCAEEGIRARVSSSAREVVDEEHVGSRVDVTGGELHLREGSVSRSSGNRASSISESTASHPGVDQLSVAAEINLEVLGRVHLTAAGVEAVRNDAVRGEGGESVGAHREGSDVDSGRGDGDGVTGGVGDVEVVLNVGLKLAGDDQVAIARSTSSARLISPAVSSVVLVVPDRASSRGPELDEEVVSGGRGDGVVLVGLGDDAAIGGELGGGRGELDGILEGVDVNRDSLGGDLVVVDGVGFRSVDGDVRVLVVAPEDSAAVSRVRLAELVDGAVVLDSNHVVSNVEDHATRSSRARGLGVEILVRSNVELVDLVALRTGEGVVVVDLLSSENGDARLLRGKRNLRLEEVEDELHLDDAHGVSGATHNLHVAHVVHVDSAASAGEETLRASALARNSAASAAIARAGGVRTGGGIAGVPVFVDID